jgi:hypothetical protein
MIWSRRAGDPRVAATSVASAMVSVVAAVVLLAGCAAGSGADSGAGRGPGRGATPPATASKPGPSRTPVPSTRPTASASPHPSASATPLPVAPGAGRLPQTQAFPDANSVAFRNAMADLWLAVTSDRPDLALPAFFPIGAYDQAKAEADPAGDWRNRLWVDFANDVAAAHHLTGGGATLVRVDVPTAQADWISPGACANVLGYWHVAGARVVYRREGQLRSFGISSLISWRGDWYVVHFGAELRDSSEGVVDQPDDGPGVPGPPGGC